MSPEVVTIADPICPWCRSSSRPDFRYADERMTVCASCGAWFVWPMPAAEQMARHYGKKTAGMSAHLWRLRAGTSQGEWYRWLSTRVARLSAGRDAREIVDVGAGPLDLTVSLAGQFPEARVEGWDLFADGIPRIPDSAAAGRITLSQVDLNRVDRESLSGRLFDIVVCVAVIEHVIDPLALLRFLHSITAPGGFAYVAMPEAGSHAHRILRRAWPYYCPDAHLTLPTRRSIEGAVAMLGGGRYQLRTLTVRYSLRYLLRYLRLPLPIPAAADVLVPIPAGGLELVWERGR